MGKIVRQREDGRYEWEKVPDMYRQGRGYLYRSKKQGIKLVEISDEIGEYSREDLVQFSRLVRICRLNFRGKQRLTYRANKYGDMKDLDIRVIMKQLGISKPTAIKFLRWCYERDYIRKDEEYGSLIVNPMKIKLGSRISGREYWTYRDVLEDSIPSRYKKMLTLEAHDGEIQEENEEEEDDE